MIMQSLKLGRLALAPGNLNTIAIYGATTKPNDNGVLPNSQLALGGIRTKIRPHRNFIASQDPEGIKYYGFTYFPRWPGKVDPPYTPTKLLRVVRIAPLLGSPHWDKKILEQFKLGRDAKYSRSHVAIVANTPANNCLLYKIKHMIDIKPITFPHGVPTDPSQGYLKENGEYVLYNKLESPKPDVEQGEEDVKELRKKNVDKLTLRNRLRYQWYSRW